MNIATLTHAPAHRVADYLDNKNGVGANEVLAALINALNRIAKLEQEVQALQPEA